jgi:hypothetical protein
MQKISLIAVLCLGLCGCKQIAFQDEVIRGARHPSSPHFLNLSENVEVEIKRGVLGDRYSALLSGGEYKPIAESEAGVFYLSPLGGFSYRENGKERTPVGGVFMLRSTGRSYVWLAPEKNESWAEWESEAKIEGFKPGLVFLESRPWVEKDLVIPQSKLTP